jgi:hypothetical protein
MRWWMLAAFASAACGSGLVGEGPPIKIQPRDCERFCGVKGATASGEVTFLDPNASPGKSVQTAIEQRVVDWTLSEVRRGVRPWSDEAIGVCRGKKTCDKFLGPDAGKLGRGTYFVRAQLKVPPGPKGTWKIDFRTECTNPAGETKTFERDFDVLYAGPDAPFELTNLRVIESPSEDGAQDCKYTLTTRDAGGAKTKYTGRWEVTGKE